MQRLRVEQDNSLPVAKNQANYTTKHRKDREQSDDRLTYSAFKMVRVHQEGKS